MLTGYGLFWRFGTTIEIVNLRRATADEDSDGGTSRHGRRFCGQRWAMTARPLSCCKKPIMFSLLAMDFVSRARI
jgi:hypothetical protein